MEWDNVFRVYKIPFWHKITFSSLKLFLELINSKGKLWVAFLYTRFPIVLSCNSVKTSWTCTKHEVIILHIQWSFCFHILLSLPSNKLTPTVLYSFCLLTRASPFNASQCSCEICLTVSLSLVGLCTTPIRILTVADILERYHSVLHGYRPTRTWTLYCYITTCYSSSPNRLVTQKHVDTIRQQPIVHICVNKRKFSIANFWSFTGIFWINTPLDFPRPAFIVRPIRRINHNFNTLADNTTVITVTLKFKVGISFSNITSTLESFLNGHNCYRGDILNAIIRKRKLNRPIDTKIYAETVKFKLEIAFFLIIIHAYLLYMFFYVNQDNIQYTRLAIVLLHPKTALI